MSILSIIKKKQQQKTDDIVVLVIIESVSNTVKSHLNVCLTKLKRCTCTIIEFIYKNYFDSLRNWYRIVIA